MRLTVFVYITVEAGIGQAGPLIRGNMLLALVLQLFFLLVPVFAGPNRTDKVKVFTNPLHPTDTGWNLGDALCFTRAIHWQNIDLPGTVFMALADERQFRAVRTKYRVTGSLACSRKWALYTTVCVK